ncbi:GATA zinc finger domain-containing protein 4-like [Condylostylus longicornis]|uniref:GATA zinc finger domain-containing protein 4-like n=1 Tax=Condylostylus longicornis TaxID=2530218 RepID=UPI00244E46B5|nr:GATA zinc finger domain-containing protein 4-like [Condylostylus longicornis]
MGKNYSLKTSSKVKMDKYDNTKSTDDANSLKYEDQICNDMLLYPESLFGNNDDSKEDLDEQMMKSTKHVRHRKRKLYNQVREQMEFYFSDANLTKDRFLMQIIREDPYVPLEIFLNFNKIKKLIKTTGELIKALSSSNKLELNDDKTRVTRIKPLIDVDENRDGIDARTIYVESLPANADHEWVKKIFEHASNDGKVTYVSLPKYKHSKKLKEFGFVEFETIDMAEKCLKTFQEFNGLLNYDNIEPINLLSITTYIKENNVTKNINDIKKEKFIKDDDCDEPKNKRIRLDIDENQLRKNDNANICNSNNNSINNNITNNTNNIDDDDMESCEANESDKELNDLSGNKRKKLRKKKKKDKKNKNLIKSNAASNTTINNNSSLIHSRPLNLEVDLKDLKILPKRDWKRLRNRYLNLQREKINNLKKKNWQRNNDISKGNPNKKQIAAVKHIGRLNQQIAASTSLQQSTQLNKSVSTSSSSSSISVQNITSSSNQNNITSVMPLSTLTSSPPSSVSSSAVPNPNAGKSSIIVPVVSSSALVTSSTSSSSPSSPITSIKTTSTISNNNNITNNNNSIVNNNNNNNNNNINNSNNCNNNINNNNNSNNNNNINNNNNCNNNNNKNNSNNNNNNNNNSNNNNNNNSNNSNTQTQQLIVINGKNFDLKKSPHMNFYRVNKEIDGALYDEDENDSQSNDTSSLDSPGINSPYSMILEKRRKLLSPITNSTKTIEIKRNNIALEKNPLFQFEPGIIIKIEFNNVIIDVKKFKNDIKQQYNIDDAIKYIDIKEGYNIVHIRCGTPKNSQLLLTKFLNNKLNLKFNNCEIIYGTEESKYWDKIMEDRDMKLNKRIVIKTKRGREKITKLISNHIRFVDDDD